MGKLGTGQRIGAAQFSSALCRVLATVPALQGASDLGIGKETDRGHDSPSESRAVSTGTARSQKNPS